MEQLKKVANSLKNSPIGAILGAVAGYYAIKKFTSVSNKWAVGALVVVGAVIGAAAEYKIKAATVKPAIAAK